MRAAVLLSGLLMSCSTSSPSTPTEDATRAYREAQEAYQAGQHDRAIERAGVAIRGAPSAPGPYLVRAKALQAKGRNGEAEADFGRAIEKSSEASRAVYHFWRGLFHHDLARFEKALQDFDRACELQSTQPNREYFVECYRLRAKTYLALGRRQDAVRDCDFILARNPDEITRKEFEDIKRQAQK